MRALALIAALSLGGCARTSDLAQEPARAIATCPEPAERMKLGPGSTYRDLAVSREQAVSGWMLCASAAKENAR